MSSLLALICQHTGVFPASGGDGDGDGGGLNPLEQEQLEDFTRAVKAHLRDGGGLARWRVYGRGRWKLQAEDGQWTESSR